MVMHTRVALKLPLHKADNGLTGIAVFVGDAVYHIYGLGL